FRVESQTIAEAGHDKASDRVVWGRFLNVAAHGFGKENGCLAVTRLLHDLCGKQELGVNWRLAIEREANEHRRRLDDAGIFRPCAAAPAQAGRIKLLLAVTLAVEFVVGDVAARIPEHLL